MNREYSYLYLSILIHVAAPRRGLRSLAGFVNTSIAVCANNIVWKQKLEDDACLSALAVLPSKATSY